MVTGKSFAPLQKLLTEERNALIEGRLDAIAALAERKEQLLRKIEREDLSKPQITALQRQIHRNMTLLAHAMTAIQDTRELLQKAVLPSSHLAYDADGTTRQLATPHIGMQRKF